MGQEIEIRDKDSVAKEVFSTINNFYSNLSNEWSHFVPENHQSSGYIPNRLVATKGRKGRLMINISFYRSLDSSKFFLGVIASSNPNGDVEVEAFLAETPESGVVEMQYGNHGCPRRREIAEQTVKCDDKDLSKVVSETTQKMSSLSQEFGSKTVKELILET